MHRAEIVGLTRPGFSVSKRTPTSPDTLPTPSAVGVFLDPAHFLLPNLTTVRISFLPPHGSTLVVLSVADKAHERSGVVCMRAAQRGAGIIRRANSKGLPSRQQMMKGASFAVRTGDSNPRTNRGQTLTRVISTMDAHNLRLKPFNLCRRNYSLRRFF